MYKVRKVGMLRESVSFSASPLRFTWNCSNTYLSDHSLGISHSTSGGQGVTLKVLTYASNAITIAAWRVVTATKAHVQKEFGLYIIPLA